MCPGRKAADTFPLPDAAWRKVMVLSLPESGTGGGQRGGDLCGSDTQGCSWTGTKGYQINQLNRNLSNCGCSLHFILVST